MKEDIQVRRRPGSHLRLQGADVTQCRGAPPELRKGRDIPDAPLLQERTKAEDEFLVRMLFRAMQAGEYTVAVFAESTTITYKKTADPGGYTLRSISRCL
jgi:hypothetical protein